MKKDISNNQTACNRAQKEKKEVFAFCIGIDLGDKHSDGFVKGKGKTPKSCGGRGGAQTLGVVTSVVGDGRGVRIMAKQPGSCGIKGDSQTR